MYHQPRAGYLSNCQRPFPTTGSGEGQQMDRSIAAWPTHLSRPLYIGNNNPAKVLSSRNGTPTHHPTHPPVECRHVACSNEAYRLASLLRYQAPNCSALRPPLIDLPSISGVANNQPALMRVQVTFECPCITCAACGDCQQSSTSLLLAMCV